MMKACGRGAAPGCLVEGGKILDAAPAVKKVAKLLMGGGGLSETHFIFSGKNCGIKYYHRGVGVSLSSKYMTSKKQVTQNNTKKPNQGGYPLPPWRRPWPAGKSNTANVTHFIIINVSNNYDEIQAFQVITILNAILMDYKSKNVYIAFITIIGFVICCMLYGTKDCNFSKWGGGGGVVAEGGGDGDVWSHN